MPEELPEGETLRKQMKTNETTAKLYHSITIVKGREKTVIKITLDDDCKNGHEYFSLTADIYEQTNHCWRDVGGGCCHKHITALRPELAPFAALHLSNADGVPMHAIGNAWYWFCGFGPGVSTEKHHGGTGAGAKLPEECRAIFGDHIRATEHQVSSIVELAPRSQVELQVILEDMGFLAQWKAEAVAAIAQLEEWTGLVFEGKATRATWVPVSEEARADIAAKRAGGYYDPEKVAARDAEKLAGVKAAKLAEIESDLCGAVEKLNRKAQVAGYLVGKYFPKFTNFIYYSHTNEVAVNWTRGEPLITKAEFDAMTAEVEPGSLPDGIKFTWQESPKY